MWHMRQTRPLSTRVIAALLAVITAFSCVPTQALAEALAETSVEQQPQTEQPIQADASAVADGSAEPADDAATDDAAGEAAASSDEGEKSSDAEDATAEQSSGASGVAVQSAYVTVDSVEIVGEDGKNLTYANNTAKVGDTVKVAAYYEDDWDDEEEITSSEYALLSYQWYIGEKQSSAPTASGYTALEGETSRELTLTADMAGKYVACKVTYGSSWQYKFTSSLKNAVKAAENPSVSPDAKMLAEAKQKLSYWKPNPAYGTDTNIVDMLSAKLKDLGYDSVTASLKSVSFTATDPAAQGSIADAGTITYFFLSNADKTTSSDYSVLRQFKPTYVLTLGSESVEFTPDYTSTLAWDTARVENYLGKKIAQAELPESVASGTVASSVKEETLPGVIYENGKKVATIEWTSSDASAAKVTSEDYGATYKASYTHGGSAANVTLTAKVSLFVSGYGNAPSTTVTKRFSTTVAPKSAEDIAAEKAELEAVLDRIVLKDFVTKQEVDPSAVEADLQLPTMRRSGIDAPAGATLSYSSSDASVAKVYGYRVIITRDIEGGTNEATITATLTKDGVTATRDIKIGIKPIAESEIDEAVSFMEKVKADYANALLGQNSSIDDVQSDLSTFAEAVPAADGSIEYHKGSDSTLVGIVASDLPGYDPMAGTSWRTYRSSDTSIIADETLRVTRPEADSLVTVESNLTYGKYESLAKAHPENAKLQSLVNQSVKATFRVTGTTDHTDPQISVSFELVGTDADGADEIWSNASRQVSYGSAADELIESVLGELGLDHTSTTTQYGYYLSDITSADGRKLGYDETTGRYWQLFVNGESSSASASGVKLAPGDSVVLYYSAWGASLDDIGNARVKASVSFIGPDAAGNNSVWYSAADVRLKAGSTVADLTVESLKNSGLTYTLMTPEVDGYFYLSDITSADGRKLGWDSQTGRYWQLYVNGAYSTVGADQVTLKPGDVVQYVYAADGEKPLDGVIVNPSVKGPDWDSDWPGYTSADKVTDAPVPTADAEAKWVSKLKESSEWNLGMSDPLLVGDYLYVAVGGKLYKKNVDTGETVENGEAALASAIDSTSRMVYADGLILVPLSSGRLQALTADTLVTKWVTDALPKGTQGNQQSISSVTVRDGYAYFGTSDADWSATYGGYLLCVRISDGKVMWCNANPNSAGYYWSGMAFAGGYGLIADDSGTVSVVNPTSGAVVSSLKIADRVRTTVLVDGMTAYVVSNDGCLHKLTVSDDGSLVEAKKVQFGFSSTSTPVLVNGKIIVGGTSEDFFTGRYGTYHYGQIAVIDAATLEVENSVCKADGNYIRQYGYDASGDVKSQPVVSVQDGETYVYFTSNCNPGGVYRYRVGDAEAEILYTPETADQNYCMASISVGSDGSLYYTNDSGKLFAIKGNGQRLPRFTVSFDAGGADASATPSQRVKQGHAVVEPAAPKRSGYTFLGWYTADGAKWDFSQSVTGEMTLYARWEKKGGSEPAVEPTQPTTPSTPSTPQGGSETGSGSGTDDGNGSGKGKGGNTTIALASNTNGADAENVDDGSQTSDEPAGEKDASAASSTSGKASSGSASTTSANADAGAEQTASQMPIWPFVGIGLGVLALILILLLGRRKKEDEE